VSEVALPPSDAPSDLLRAGRDAIARHAWQDAFDLLTRADREAALPGADLEALAMAAFFAARADERLEYKERAFKAHLDADNRIRSAFVALDIAHELGMRGKGSIASSWARRAERLLEDQPESYAHAFLALIQAEMAKSTGDVETAVELATAAVDVARRTGHPDVHAMALTTLATLRIATGATTEGFALLEEAALAAVNGELSLVTAGVTSCTMISACRDLTDYQRANEWIEATDRWCERQELSGFPGVCRVHRAEVLALRGGWERAEQELRKATTELEAYQAIPPMADGLYAIGEIRRLKGDFAGAEDALRQAHAMGRSPQPALALIRLGAGNVKSASAAIEAALAEPNWDQWARARLLAAQVEISVAAGDAVKARTAADELARIVGDYPSPALEAGRHMALGRVLLAEGDGTGAVGELRAAIRSWREVGAPYEVAKVRALLARALRAAGVDDDADFELRAARDEFERLGATPDLTATEAHLREVSDRRARPSQVRRTFLFTDIVGSTNLAEALGDEAWERMLAWHDEALRTLFARAGGEVVNSTGDGFFVAFESSRVAIECAVAIQRALDDHRRTSGFAPPVRIGLHAANATQRGHDYSGMGVHLAARIAGLAQGGEVVASAETLSEADVEAVGAREVQVKGVSVPVGIASVTWS
jgi:class 3 adenylate cyclase